MISDKTVILCVLLISITVSLYSFEDIFDRLTDSIFNPHETVDLDLLQKQANLRNEIFDNINNNDYFYEKIRQTDVYKAFVEKYPNSTLTPKYTDDVILDFVLYHVYSNEPLSVIMIIFDISSDNGLIETYYSCIGGDSSGNVYHEIPILLWITSDRCPDLTDREASSYPNDMTIFYDMLLDAFEDLEDLINEDYILYDGITLTGVQLNNEVLLVEVDATQAQSPVLYDKILDEILDVLEIDVPIILEITQ